ncbi:hypothetical protein D3C81_2205170 [compost metagenome]
MGRAITVEIKDLVLAGCTIVANQSEPYFDELTQTTEVSKYITVVIPGANAISSWCDDCLNFDCRNENSNNYWAEAWLIKCNIPYNAG